MDPWIIALMLWMGMCIVFVRGRVGRTQRQSSRRIVFKPTEIVPPSQLFGILLSGNAAMLEGDNFNQLASALPIRRTLHLLRRYWAVDSRDAARRTIERKLDLMGTMTPSETSAIDACIEGRINDSFAFEALRNVQRFLVTEAAIATPGEIGPRHLGVLAWDIQQTAYLVRLSVAGGLLSRESAEAALCRLQNAVRGAYGSWNDYSLAALIGMAIRGHFDAEDPGDWHRIARTHAAFLDLRFSPIAKAKPWVRAGAPCPTRRARPSRNFGSAVPKLDA